MFIATSDLFCIFIAIFKLRCINPISSWMKSGVFVSKSSGTPDNFLKIWFIINSSQLAEKWNRIKTQSSHSSAWLSVVNWWTKKMLCRMIYKAKSWSNYIDTFSHNKNIYYICEKWIKTIQRYMEWIGLVVRWWYADGFTPLLSAISVYHICSTSAFTSWMK